MSYKQKQPNNQKDQLNLWATMGQLLLRGFKFSLLLFVGNPILCFFQHTWKACIVVIPSRTRSSLLVKNQMFFMIFQ